MKKISTFSERLKIIMDLNSISANALADVLDINKSIISRYLSGKMQPRQNRLDQIATYFHISHAWLMGYDCEMYSDDIKNSLIKLIDKMTKNELLDLYSYARILKGGDKKWKMP